MSEKWRWMKNSFGYCWSSPSLPGRSGVQEEYLICFLHVCDLQHSYYNLRSN
ncbi:hypothetical protein Bca4012_018514 [Brassica carinata]